MISGVEKHNRNATNKYIPFKNLARSIAVDKMLLYAYGEATPIQ